MWAASELTGATPYWLLDLDGTRWRFADDVLTVDDANGSTWSYASGLDAMVLEHAPTEGDVAIRVVVRSGEDWPLHAAQGYHLEGRTAVLRRWWSGLELERARVHIAGLIEGVVMADPSAPNTITFSIKRTSSRDAEIVPAATQVVDDSTWPIEALYTIQESTKGSFYPVIIGAPGGSNISDLLPNPVPTTPALYAEVLSLGSKYVVAGHRVQATNVYFYNMDNSATLGASAQVIQSEDLLGQPVAYVQNISPVALQGVDGERFFVGWRDDASYGGGLIGEDGGLLRGAGDVISYLLQRYCPKVKVNNSQMEAHKAFLNVFFLDCMINSPVSMWDFVAQIIKVLPVRLVTDDGGLWLQPWRTTATTSDVAAWLEAGRNVDRVSPAKQRRATIYNQIVVQYQPIQQTGKYRKTVMISAEDGVLKVGPSHVLDIRVHGDYRCSLSQALYGVREMTLNLPWIWDDSTALGLAREQVGASALTKRGIEYVGSLELERLRPGDIVALTDADLHLTDALCRVEALVVGGPQVGLDLTLLDDPSLASQAT